MPRLIGDGIGTGMGLGTAVVVQTQGGMPLVPEAPPRIAKLIELRRLSEFPEVILVANDYRTATILADNLSWARVVGIAAGRSNEDDPVTSIPAVVGLKGIENQVQDDQLVLVDAVRGVVIVDPDPAFLAQYTAEHDNVAPRRRTYLDDAHRRAETLDGVPIRVLAYADTLASLKSAMEQGADALFISADSELIGSSADDASLRGELDSLIDAAPGKTLFCADNYKLSRRVLCEYALRADIVVALPPRSELEGLGLREEQEALVAIERVYIQDDVPCGIPRLALNLIGEPPTADAETALSLLERFAATGASRIVVGFDSGELGHAGRRSLSHLCDAAHSFLTPVIVALLGISSEEEQMTRTIQDMIAIGVSGVIFPADFVSAVKQAIRALDAEECRRALLER